MQAENRIAGPGARAIAYLIDWHIKLLLALAVFLLLLFFGKNLSEAQSDFSFLLAIFLLYQPIVEMYMRGSSPGKRITGIRVVSDDDKPASALQLLVRNLFRVIDCIPGVYSVGLIASMKTENNGRIGDKAARTKVVYTD